MILLLSLSLSTLAFADEKKKIDYSKLSVEDVNLASQQLQDNRIDLLKETPLNGPRTLREEVDFFGEFLKRMLKTANTVIVFDKLDKAYVGLEFNFLEKDKWDIVWGFYPDEEKITGFYFGVERKEVPLISSLGEVFKRLDVAGLYCPDKKIKVAISYEWRN